MIKWFWGEWIELNQILQKTGRSSASLEFVYITDKLLRSEPERLEGDSGRKSRLNLFRTFWLSPYKIRGGWQVNFASLAKN